MPNQALLTTEAQKWQTRIAQVTAAGLAPGPITELAKTDLQRIAQGGSTLPDDQVTSMVHSAYTGQVQTPTPQQQNKPADWSPLSIGANISRDIGTDVRSWPAGIIHLGADIINPHKWSETGGDIAKFKFGSISDMAKEIQAMPIIGPLTPWTFALTAGFKGFTQHPLNFVLSAASIAAPVAKFSGAAMGLDAAEGSPLASLQDGHPFKAGLQAIGAYDPAKAKILEELNKTQFGPTAMSVWKKYSALGRSATTALLHHDLAELDKLGLGPDINRPGQLSMDERIALVKQVETYNPRFETQPLSLSDPSLAPALASYKQTGDLTALTQSIPSGKDIIAFTTTDVGAGAAGPVTAFLDQATATNSIPEPLRGHVKVNEIKVSPADLSSRLQMREPGPPGTVSARNVLPNITYTPERTKLIHAVKDWIDKHSTLHPKLEDGKGPMSVAMLDGQNFGYYPNTSAPIRRMAEYHTQSKFVNDGMVSVKDIQAKLNEVVAQHTGPTLPSLYKSAQSAILKGMQDEQLRPLWDRVDQAFTSGDVRKLQSTLSSLERTYTRTGRTAEASSITDLKGNLRGITQHTKVSGIADRRAQMLSDQLAEARYQLTTAIKHRDAAKTAYYKALQKSPSAAAQPLAESAVRTNLANEALKQTAQSVEYYQAHGMSDAINQALDAYTEAITALHDPTRTPTAESMMGLKSARSGGDPFFDAQTFKRVQRESIASWTDMVKGGFDPIWVHQVDTQWAKDKIFASAKPLAKVFKPSQDRARIFDYAPQVLDISARLSHQAMEYRTELATNQFIDFMVGKSGAVHTKDAMIADMEKRFPGQGEQIVNRETVPYFNPNDPTKDYVTSRVIDKGLNTLMPHGQLGGPVGKALRGGHNVFKVAVLSGPRHMVHVGIGGLVQVALAEPGALTELAHPKVLFNMVRGGGLPDELRQFEGDITEMRQSGALFKGQYEQLAGSLHAFRGGSKLGEWFRQSMVGRGLHSAEDRINRVENITTDMYRAAIALDQLKHGAEQEAAISLVNKVLIDVDNLTPFEQTTIRSIFPFWSFTKHALRYVLTYPADHPVRAAILSQLAQHIEDTNQSGDPGRLSKLFFLGSPDKLGNVTSMDFSNVNPFRSMSSIFSMAGFLQGLAPEFQVVAKGFGLNTLTGTPSLFQNYTYDQYSGTNIAKRPGINLYDFASAFIPQTQILDHYLLLTDSMRQLKKSNPEAYQRTLMQEMNLPFTVAPINIYDVRAKAAAMQFRDAQTAVTDAMKTGNTSTLRQYIAVPFQGYLFPAADVANYIDGWNKIAGGKVSPKAIATKVKLPTHRGVF